MDNYAYLRNKEYEPLTEENFLSYYNRKKYDEIIKHNLRLVYKIALKYKGLADIDDLFQEGVLCLTKGIDKFDVSKNIAFSTWAYKVIERGIQAYVNKSKNGLSYSGNLAPVVHKVKTMWEQGYSKESIVDVLMEENGYTEILSEQIFSLAMTKLISIDTPIGDEDDTIGSVIPDTSVSDVDKDILMEEQIQELKEIAEEVLSERQKKVLFYRYGLVDGNGHTLKEIAGLLNLRIEQVRLTEHKALQLIKRKIKRNNYEKERKSTLQMQRKRISKS